VAQHGKSITVARQEHVQQLSIFPAATFVSAILELARIMRTTRKAERRTRWVCQLGQADTLAGGLICGMAAAVASVVAAGSTWRVFVPLVFTAVLLLVAFYFGTRAGIAGTALAALIFATLLFNPLGRWHVADGAARSNLGWMLLIGLAFSFLFAPPTSGFRHR
jgi:K+-sensing histidine kinase KdpD